MRHLLIALYLLPTMALAQQLHTFKNGEVADAGKINENFELLQSEHRTRAKPGDRLIWQNNTSWLATGTKESLSDGTVSYRFESGELVIDGRSFALSATSNFYSQISSNDSHILCSSGTYIAREAVVILSSLSGYIVLRTNSPDASMNVDNEKASLSCSNAGNYLYLEVVASAGSYQCAHGFVQWQVQQYESSGLPLWEGSSMFFSASVPIVQGYDAESGSGTTIHPDSYLEIPLNCP